MALSERERITLLIMRGWGDLTRSYSEVQNLFNDSFPNRNPIARSTVASTINRFLTHGTVSDLPRSGRPPSATNEDSSVEVLQSFVENPHETLRSAAAKHDMSHPSVLKVLHKSGFKPYKLTLHQELNEDDFDRRLEFCETMMNKLDLKQILLNNIVFSDEATFMLNGHVNKHNCRFWNDSNPHWMIEGHTQHPQKLNVWAGIIRGRIVGPFFIDGNLGGDSYLALLQTHIIPTLQNILGENLVNIWFQQDGAPPHYKKIVRDYLDVMFPQRWIGRRGTIEWPARSPDLTPLDFFFWGCLKDRVYKTNPQNLEELRNRILEESRWIENNGTGLQNAIDAFYHRLAHCQTTEGGHFEHLL